MKTFGILVLLVGVGIAILFLFTKGTTEVVKTAVDETHLEGQDARRVADINLLKIELGLYFDDLGSFPEDLTALRGRASDSLIESVLTNEIYKVHYATNGTAYHIGTSLESSRSQNALSHDGDFNSRSVGWAGGFDGDDSQPCGSGDTEKSCYDITSTQ